MKKIYIPLALTAVYATGLFFTPVSVAQATVGNFQQNSEARQENRQERRVEVAENVQERQDNRQENREGRQENRQERRDDMAQRHADRLSNRFGIYSSRLQNLIGKLDTRLTMLETDGKDVTAAKAKLSQAKETLASAKSLGEQSTAAFLAIEPATYESQRDKALAARDLAMQAREKYKTTISLLKEVVQLAKSAK